jgi:hypothetical protein
MSALPGFSPRGSLNGASSGTLGQFSASLSLQTVLTNNQNRVGAFFYNNSPGNAYIALSTTASLGFWTNKVAPSGSWALAAPIYGGVVTVVFDATGVGALMVTETSSPEGF